MLAVWEEYDLRTSVLGPDEAYPGVPRGVALLDVTDDGHELSWHPFRIGTARCSVVRLRTTAP